MCRKHPADTFNTKSKKQCETPKKPPYSALLSNTQWVQMPLQGQRWPPYNLFDSDFSYSVNPSLEYWRWAAERGAACHGSLKEQTV